MDRCPYTFSTYSVYMHNIASQPVDISLSRELNSLSLLPDFFIKISTQVVPSTKTGCVYEQTEQYSEFSKM